MDTELRERESLGLSIGVTNLVAARVGSTPLTRKSVLTLFDHRASELDVPGDKPNPTGTGQVIRGFVERVGDQAPLVAADGTPYFGEALTVEALDALARTAGYGSPISIAVPAHWSKGQFAALHQALSAKPTLAAPGSLPPVPLSDATAGFAALYAKPGFPTSGVVVLCDFGASGTNVTLADAASNYQQIGSTVRYTDFSGDHIDQLILSHLQTGAIANAGHTSTGPIGSLSRRLNECRQAKEQLSAATMTVVPAEMPGFGQDVRLYRGEFEHIISGPLDRFITFVEQILQRNKIPNASLAAVATVGGGASIPLITTRLSERLQVPIFTTQQPAFSAAIGAAVLGEQRSHSSTPTAPAAFDAPADLAVGQPTEISPAAWAIQAAGNAAGESVDDDDQSGTYRALAWSQEAGSVADPVPYTGDDEDEPQSSTAQPESAVQPRTVAPPKEVLPWYRATLLLGAAGVAAVILVGVVVAVAFELARSHSPTENPTNITPPVESSPLRLVPEQSSETGPPPTTTESEIPPSPPPPPPSTTLATQPTTTWATTQPTPTTTQPTTTWATPTTPSTSAPTTSAYPPSTYPSVTTRWPLTTTPHGPATITQVPKRPTLPGGY